MNESLTMLRQAVARAHNAVKMVLGRGRIQLVGNNDQGPVQTVQVIVSAKETMDLPRVAEFGFASRPPKDSDCIVVFLNGERTWGVVVGTNNQKFRMSLENDGEAALHDAFGKSIWLKKDGGIVVEANNEAVEINHAKKITLGAGTDGIAITTGGNVTVDLGGKDLTFSNVGNIALGPGGKKVVVDGDPVSGGFVHSTQTKVSI